MLLEEEADLGERARKVKITLGVVVGVLCLLYAVLAATRSFPPTEGWYSYYAYQINEKGAVPYVDFELLFPPLYVYVIAAFTKIFGYGFLALRIFGALVFAGTGTLSYLIFLKLTKKPVFAAFAGVLAAAILQSEAVQIFYDYIRLMDLSVYASLYCFLCVIDKIERETKKCVLTDPALYLGAVFAVTASLYKQSSGLFFLLFCGAFFLFAALVSRRRRAYLLALGVLAGVTVVLYGVTFAFLGAYGALSAYFYYNFRAAAAAKGGSVFSLLFGFIPRSLKNLGLGALGAALVFSLLFLFRTLSRRAPARKEERPRPLFWWLFLSLSFAVCFTGASFLFEKHGAWWIGEQKMFTAFLVATAVFVVSVVFLIRARLKKTEAPAYLLTFCFFTGVLFTLGYAVCTSGGLCESQVALCYPLVASLFLPAFRFHGKRFATLSLAFLMLLNTGFGIERKTWQMYSWWGLQTGMLAEQTERVDTPLLRGISMSPAYARMYRHVLWAAETHTTPADEIFVFPHMPVLYLLTERERATKTAIQWLDVATDQAVRDDIEVLREKKPRLVVVCRIHEYVRGTQEESFRAGEESGLTAMQNFLSGFLSENYVPVCADTISDGYTVEVWRLSTSLP